MSAALFLDRDGTIIKDVGDVKYINQIKFYEYTFEALQNAQRYFSLFIVTNQPGIAKGVLTHDDVNTIHTYIKDVLQSKGIRIEAIYYCPHSREDNCNCRKPNTYFVEYTIKKYNMNRERSYIIGDHPSDIELAQKSGMNGIYVLTGHGLKHRKEIADESIVKRNLKYAIDYICSM